MITLWSHLEYIHNLSYDCVLMLLKPSSELNCNRCWKQKFKCATAWRTNAKNSLNSCKILLKNQGRLHWGNLWRYNIVLMYIHTTKAWLYWLRYCLRMIPSCCKNRVPCATRRHYRINIESVCMTSDTGKPCKDLATGGIKRWKRIKPHPSPPLPFPTLPFPPL